MLKNNEKEIKLLPSRQMKLTLIGALSGRSGQSAMAMLKDQLRLAQFDIQALKTEAIRDEYFDTEGLALLPTGASCRVRHRGSERLLEVKMTAGRAAVQSRGLFDRDEYSRPLTLPEYMDFMDKAIVPEEARALFAKEAGPLRQVCQVTDDRRVFRLTRGASIYKLSIDRCSFLDPTSGHRARNEFIEIEIEAASDEAQSESDKLRQDLALILQQTNAFDFSSRTKYQEAAHRLRIRQPRVIKRLFGRDVELGIGIGLLGLLAGPLILATSLTVGAFIIVVLLMGLVFFCGYEK